MASIAYRSSTATLNVARIAYSDATATLKEAASVYLGSLLVWSKATETWVANTSGNCFVASFTPTVNMTVASFSMILSTAQAYNYVRGIWRLSGSSAVPVTNAVFLNATNVTTENVGTLGANTKYKHTCTYPAGSRPTLVAGNTYLFHLGDRYSNYSILSGGSSYSGYMYDWAVSATSTITYVANGTASNIYLSVVGA